MRVCIRVRPATTGFSLTAHYYCHSLLTWVNVMQTAKPAAAVAPNSGKSSQQNAGVMPTEAEKILPPDKKTSDTKTNRGSDKDHRKNKGGKR